MSRNTLDKDFKLLDLEEDATAQEARRAYHKKKALYSESSLATYSLMPAEERDEVLDHIERAYMRISMEIESRSTARSGLLFPDDTSPPAPPKPGESIGAYLKRCREHLGFTLRDIATKTRIRTTYIEHIENERISDLPAPVYLRGFVLEFARVLDLPDPESVTAAYLKLIDKEEE